MDETFNGQPVVNWMKATCKIALKHIKFKHYTDEYISECYIILLRCIKLYDPHRVPYVMFSTYLGKAVQRKVNKLNKKYADAPAVGETNVYDQTLCSSTSTPDQEAMGNELLKLLEFVAPARDKKIMKDYFILSQSMRITARELNISHNTPGLVIEKQLSYIKGLCA